MAWASQQAQLDALQAARALVRSHHGEDIGHLAFIALARSLGSRNPQGRTLCCIIAVLDQLEHPGKFASDREAWEAHGAKQSNFKTWKGRIGHLISAELVDEVELSSQESATLSSALSEAEVRHTRGIINFRNPPADKVQSTMLPDPIVQGVAALGCNSQGRPSTGTALRWNEGFGFIKPDDGGENLFCHFSSITDGNMLQEGDTVQFVKRYDDRKGKDRAEDVIGGIAGDDRATNVVCMQKSGKGAGGVDEAVADMRAHTGLLWLQQDRCNFLCLALQSHGCGQAVVEAGGVGAVVVAMRAHTGDLDMQLYGCNLLESVAMFSWPGRQAVVEAGGVDAVLNAMKAHDDDCMQRNACDALCRVAVDDEGRQAVVEAGGVKTVMEMMQAHAGDLGVQQSGCKFLYCVATDGEGPPNYRTRMMFEEQGVDKGKLAVVEASACGVEVVVAAMQAHTGDLDLQQNGCAVLSNVAVDNASWLEEGGVGAAIAAMRAHTGDLDVQRNGCVMLYHVQLEGEGRQVVVEEGGVETVVAAMRAHPGNLDVQENGCALLCDLGMDAIMAAGGIDVLRTARVRVPADTHPRSRDGGLKAAESLEFFRNYLLEQYEKRYKAAAAEEQESDMLTRFYAAYNETPSQIAEKLKQLFELNRKHLCRMRGVSESAAAT